MLTILRSLARQLRAVIRKAAPLGSPRGLKPPILLEANRQGLCVRVQLPDVAVEYHQAGSHAPGSIHLPFDALDGFSGRHDVPILLEEHGPDTLQARWDDGGVPQVRQFAIDHTEIPSSFPEPPARFTALDRAFLQALDVARHCVARDGVRYSLQKLQFRGGTGEIVASDGRQLLVQKGFAFPWSDDVLVPALAVFGCPELPQDGSVSIGRTNTHVAVRVGPWTFHLAIDAQGRFPRTENVIPSLTGTVTTCHLSPQDAEFLVHTLPRLPGEDADQSPLTIDLNGHVAVRARAENQDQVTELVLSRSTVEGPPVRLVSNRHYLARMVQLGFHELKVVKADVPLVCEDATRKFVWMPLEKVGALPPSDNCLRIASNGKAPKPSPPKKERRSIPMSTPSTNDNKNGHVVTPPPANSDSGSKPPTSINGLMEEAAELRSLLRDAYARVGRFLDALKRHRQQSKLLRSTLTSLKQLQQIDG